MEVLYNFLRFNSALFIFKNYEDSIIMDKGVTDVKLNQLNSFEYPIIFIKLIL